MGLFDFLKKDKKEEVKSGLAISAPLTGVVKELSEVPDEVFSSKMMGDGFSIEPKDGKIVSPINGEVTTIFPTGHAIGLKTADGVEVLIHFGLDTVALNGEGFEKKVEAGDKVNVGDVLVEVNIDEVQPKVPSIMTPIIFTNLVDYKLEINANVYGKEVSAGEELFTLNK